MVIKWNPYPQVKPNKDGNYVVVVKFDDKLIIETDYWQGWWDDNDDELYTEIQVIAWAELPTLEDFNYLTGAENEQYMDTLQ